ncbi:uncharacterized protein LOC130018094, partial [Sorex fumeus]|uniref:uncharacterized protein LOC130018094 n=1 Tax=Sorex fumeus TaxID=62283 RepID=UPI0024ACFE54
MVQARKIKYDVTGLTETRRYQSHHASFDTEKELFLKTCDKKSIGGVSVLVKTNMDMSIDSFEWESPGGQFHHKIDHIVFNQWFCLTNVTVVPKFQTGLNHHLLRAKFYFTEREEKAARFKKRTPRTTNWELFGTTAATWKDAVIDNIDKEYDQLVQQLHDCVRNAKRKMATKENSLLIHQRDLAHASDNHKQTSELTKQYRDERKEDLKGRRALVLADVARAGKSIHNAHLSLANYKTKMTALQHSDGSITSSRRAMENIIHDFYLYLFDSHVHLPTYQIPQAAVPTREDTSRRFQNPKASAVSQSDLEDRFEGNRSHISPVRKRRSQITALLSSQAGSSVPFPITGSPGSYLESGRHQSPNQH